MSERTGTGEDRVLEERAPHVWLVNLDDASLSDASALACLSPGERERAERTVGAVERRRFIASRAALRRILSGYHGCAAGSLRLSREPRGRPFVEDAERLHFSLSHARDLAAIAVAAAPVGIDIEYDRPVQYLDRIARRILHPDTTARLDELDDAARRDRFLDAWTQREAHVKAVGGGLFHTADVLPLADAAPDGRPRTVRSREDGTEWSVVRFRPAEDVRAALVMAGAIERVLFMEDVQ